MTTLKMTTFLDRRDSEEKGWTSDENIDGIIPMQKTKFVCFLCSFLFSRTPTRRPLGPHRNRLVDSPWNNEVAVHNKVYLESYLCHNGHTWNTVHHNFDASWWKLPINSPLRGRWIFNQLHFHRSGLGINIFTVTVCLDGSLLLLSVHHGGTCPGSGGQEGSTRQSISWWAWKITLTRRPEKFHQTVDVLSWSDGRSKS